MEDLKPEELTATPSPEDEKILSFARQIGAAPPHEFENRKQRRERERKFKKLVSKLNRVKTHTKSAR